MSHKSQQLRGPCSKSNIIYFFALIFYSANSLFSIPRNKRFVCVNANPDLRLNPLTESVNLLATYIDNRKKTGLGDAGDNDSDSEDEIRPFKGFAKPLNRYKVKPSETEDEESKPNRLLALIKEHVDEALTTGFDDSIAKFKGKSHFVVSWDML